MWTTFLGKHIKPSLAEIVLALIPSRICNYQFRNRLDSLTLCNTRTVTFKLVAAKNRCSWFTQLYICASYSLFVFVICCAFICSVILLVQLFYSLFDYSFCSIFIWVLLIVVQKKKNNSEPELCSGISILLTEEVPAIQQVPVTCSPPSSRVNNHHTADSTDFVLV